MKIKDLKNKVETILRDFPETRNSDITLMIELWKKYYPKYIKENKEGGFGVYLQDLYELPREDGIKRVRAMIQNIQGKYLPTDLKVVIQRKINEEKWHAYMAGAFNPELNFTRPYPEN